MDLGVVIRPAAVIGEVIEFAVPIGVAQSIEPDSQHCPRRGGNPHRREPQPERGDDRFGRGVLSVSGFTVRLPRYRSRLSVVHRLSCGLKFASSRCRRCPRTAIESV